MENSQSGNSEGLLFHNARKIDASGQVDGFWMLVREGRITATGVGAAPDSAEIERAERVDLGGDYLTPGFIDLHCHGGGGHSFDDSEQEIRAAIATHRSYGTTRSVLSLVSNPIASLVHSLEQISDLAESDPTILGSHLEGPFLSNEKRGAHNPVYLTDPTPDLVEELLGAAGDSLRQVTIAPELPGAMAAIDQFAAAGVKVAIGHSDADYSLTLEAFDRGASILTHAFNAMNGIGHRAPGPVPAALNDPRVTVELILDGLHVHPAVAKIAFETAGDRIALVTDAMAAAGSDDGEYRLGSLNVTVRDGRATIAGGETIAGSTLTLDKAVKNAIFELNLTPVAAITAATVAPARALGVDEDFGFLREGLFADAVALDSEFNVKSVWIAGSRVID
ncbi:MAG: N-acetylglucosamine-6-phosphate deacetylase [Homoserinimonas sp.]|nr:N-acetylglucosamine-6-phosphate deacetylase [Homoserinimonas sp.]